MLILALETSTKTGSVAVASEKSVIAQYTLNIEITHSERLMSTVDRVLKDTGLAIRDLSCFAVSIGPGSFTGLRIGISTVKGLALATGKPIAAVPTLQALAWNLPYAAYPVCPMLDARKNEVYAAIYRFKGNTLEELMPETALPIADIGARLPGTILFTGEASALYRAAIERELGERAVFAPFSAILPSAGTIAKIGLEMITSEKYADPDGVSPLYIRRPEAEVAWEKRITSR